MKLFPVVLLGAGLALGGCGKKQPAAPTKPVSQQNYGSGNPVTAPVDYLGTLAKGKDLASRVAVLSTLNEAVREFNAGEGRYPKSLRELVTSGYLPKLPRAPYGTRIVYNPATHQVTVVQQPQRAPQTQLPR